MVIQRNRLSFDFRKFLQKLINDNGWDFNVCNVCFRNDCECDVNGTECNDSKIPNSNDNDSEDSQYR